MIDMTGKIWEEIVLTDVTVASNHTLLETMSTMMMKHREEMNIFLLERIDY